MRKKTILIIVLTGICSFLHAQRVDILGRICSQHKAVIENATIRLRAVGDSVRIVGGTSDAKGLFRIREQVPGDYILEVSCIGFSTSKLALDNIRKTTDLGDILLDSVSVMLSEVSVEAKQMVRKVDRILLFPTMEQKKHASDAFGVLNNIMLPKIDVNMMTNTVTTLGQNVTLCIDGREATKDEVLGLRPQDIQRIEYHDLPAGRFSICAAVIDYITVRRTSGGYVALRSTQMRYSGDYMITTFLNYKKSIFSLSYSPSYSRNSHSENSAEFFNAEQKMIQKVSEGLPSYARGRSNHIQMSYNYHSKSDLIYIKAGFYVNNSPESRFASKNQYIGGNGLNSFIEEDRSVSKGKMPYISFSHQHGDGMKNTFSLWLTGEYHRNDYSRIYEEESLSGDAVPYRINTDADEKMYTYSGSASYWNNFENKSNLTLQLNYIGMFSTTDYRGSLSEHSKLNIGETILFLMYTYPLGKLRLNGRLGASYQTYILNGGKVNHYFFPRPSFSAQYSINENNTLQYQAYMGNSSPQVSNVSEVVQQIDGLQQRRGNPHLRTSKLLTQNLYYWTTVGKANLTFYATHNAKFDPKVNEVSYEDGYYVHSLMNYDTFHQIKAGVSATKGFLKNKLVFKASGGYKYIWFVHHPLHKLGTWFGDVSGSYYYKAWRFNLYANSTANELYENRIRQHGSAKYGFSVSYSNGNFSAMLGAENPFGGYRGIEINYESELYSSFSLVKSKAYNYNFYLRLGWNINFGKKMKYDDPDMDINRESTILK